MQPVRPALPFTYDDYAAIPADGKRWELIEGEFEVNPAPSTRHQTVSRRLLFELMKVLEEPGLASVFDAPWDVILSPTDVVQPDLVIVSSARQHLISERGMEGPPDIVVEILSPGTRVLDVRVKRALYARFAVPEYWIVDPVLGQVEQYRANGERYELLARFDRASRLNTPSFDIVDIELEKVFRD